MSLLEMPVFYAIAFSAMLTTGLWYRVTFILHARGYPMSLVQGHYQDLCHLHLLIATEPDLTRRRRYRRLQSALRISITMTVFLCAAVCIATSIEIRSQPVR